MADGEAFETWYRQVETPLRRALVAAYGTERGREATAEAFAWAWQHRDRLEGLQRPVAFLYRVGQSRSRRRLSRIAFQRVTWAEPWIEPELTRGLSALSERQRVAVILIHGYDWTLAEVAELLEVKVTTAQNHLERGMTKLRALLEVHPDA